MKFIFRNVAAYFKKKGPKFFAQNFTDRNVDALVFGSAKAHNYTSRLSNYLDDEHVIMNLTCYQRSLFSDFNILKSFFSHLKEKGAVFICIDSVEALKLGNQINPQDYRYYHKHLLMAMDLQAPTEKLNNPLVHYPRFSIGYILNEFLGHLSPRWYWGIPFLRWNARKTDNEKLRKLTGQIRDIYEFCNEREIIPYIVFLESGPCDRKMNRRMIDLMDPQIPYCAVKTPGDLKEVICTRIISPAWQRRREQASFIKEDGKTSAGK